MARNLVKNGYKVYGFDVNTQVVKALAADVCYFTNLREFIPVIMLEQPSRIVSLSSPCYPTPRS
jgi:CRISPR/Cas system-associated protein endoribonuclease Cas2